MGETNSARILLRAWMCGQCFLKNWPCRTSCKRCGSNRTAGARRVDDWWPRHLVPRGCEFDAWPRPGVGGGPEADAAPTRRVVRDDGPRSRTEGALAQPTGRRVLPSAWSGLPGQGGRSGPAGERGGGGLGGRGEAAGQARQQQQQLRSQVEGRGGGGGGGGQEDDGRETEAVEGAGGGQLGRQSAGQQRPQPREFDVPKAPRRWIAQQSNAAKEELERVMQSGAGQRKLRRAEEKKERLEEILRQAGGPPSRELHFEIKAESERKRKAKKSYEVLQGKKEVAERRIEELRRDIKEWEEEQEECKRRESVSERRLEYLAAQQLVDTMSDERLARIREAAASVVNGVGRDSIGPIMDLIAVMVPPAEVDLAAGDTDGEEGSESSSTKFDLEDDPMGGDQEPPSSGRREVEEDQGVKLRRELREAKELLSSALNTRAAAIQEAEEARRKRRKHGGEEDSQRKEGGDEDEEMLPLGPEHATRMHDVQVEILEGQVRRLEDLLEENGDPIVPPRGAEGPTVAEVERVPVCSLSPRGDAEQQSVGVEGGDLAEAETRRRASHEWMQHFEGRFVTAEDRDGGRQLREQLERERGALERGVEGLRRTVVVNETIKEQQRLQDQHELEAEAIRLAKAQLGDMADPAKVARVQRRTYRNLLVAKGEPGSGPAALATYGPTGRPLEEMQVSMRQSASGSEGAPSSTRWERQQGRGRKVEGGGGEGRREGQRCRSQSPPGRQPREQAGARGARSKSPRGHW